MAKALLINPSHFPSYGGGKASALVPIYATLGLAAIAATARKRGHTIKILDMQWRPYDFRKLRDLILDFQPDFIGVTATTPLMNQARDISILAKDLGQELQKEIITVVGGPHSAALPFETLQESLFDVVCLDEGDYSFAELCDGFPFEEIRGIYYRDGSEIRSTPRRTIIADMDELPMPAWDLYDPEDYGKQRRGTRMLAKRPPVGVVEFSRGCVFRCDFCASKLTKGLGYRKKSPERCAAEVKRLYELGFREFMIADDIFTSDQKWATEVSNAIADLGLDMVWTCTTGIRVESADETLFRAMRRAGCYRVAFGFESGNDQVLRDFGKGGRASLEQGRTAVRASRDAGIEAFGFFLLGLSPDTEETMMDTINYARELPLDIIKFGITISFPGTKMFNEYAEKGLIRSYDWDEYFIYTDEALFAHPNLSYKTIQRFMQIAFKKALFLNPSFILRRIKNGLITGEFFWDIYFGLKTFSTPVVGKKFESLYYARDRWPEWDFRASPLRALEYQVFKKTDAGPVAGVAAE
jgi:radical SAM superfamily enzyme YgiQ (UPF0313 family)